VLLCVAVIVAAISVLDVVPTEVRVLGVRLQVSQTTDLQHVYRILAGMGFLASLVFLSLIPFDLMEWRNHLRELRTREALPEKTMLHCVLAAKLVLTVYLPPLFLFTITEYLLAAAA
jgi:hypothetical protein